MQKYLLFCLAFCVLGCLAQDLIVRPNDPIIYKKEGGALFLPVIQIMNDLLLIQYMK